ncbi:high-affinity nicotinic acid transporter [Verticillium dahliae]
MLLLCIRVCVVERFAHTPGGQPPFTLVFIILMSLAYMSIVHRGKLSPWVAGLSVEMTQVVCCILLITVSHPVAEADPRSEGHNIGRLGDRHYQRFSRGTVAAVGMSWFFVVQGDPERASVAAASTGIDEPGSNGSDTNAVDTCGAVPRSQEPAWEKS